MDYIINVRAELDANSESNLKKELGDIKSNLESQKIKIKFDPDFSELDLSKIRQKLESEKFTLKIGDVEFEDSKITNSAKAVGQKINKALTDNGVADYVKKTKNEVVSLTDNYSKLYNLIKQSSKIKMPDIMHGVKVKQEKDENGKDVWVRAEPVKYTKEQIMQIQKQMDLLKVKIKLLKVVMFVKD